MEIRQFRGLPGWGMVGALVLAISAPGLFAETGGPETREEAGAFLRALVRTDAMEQRVAAALEALESDAYPERMRGTRALLREPMLPDDLVERALGEGSADMRLRLGQIRAFHGPGRLEALLAGTLRLIAGEAWEGFGPDVLGALEGRDDQAGGLWQATMAAMAVTAVPSDAAVLREALGSSFALVRGAGVAGLAARDDGEAIEEIAALAGDANPHIVLAVAGFLRGQRDRRCLAAYVSLLDAEDYAVRWQAAGALRALTGKTFGYAAGARGAKRWVALLNWRSWLRGSAATAELDFESAPDKALVLFDGLSLEGWHEVGDEDAEGWAVEDGVLVCTGFHNAGGYLRTEGAYQDYRLSLEYRLPGGAGDSGIGLFMDGEDVMTPDCLEVQLLSGKTGDLYRIGSFEAMDAEGRPIQFQKGREGDPVERAADWNLIECEVAGGRMEVRLNGVPVNLATGCPEKAGRICLRNEGGRVEFRSLVLTPLRP